eukprot:jgi/Tetstr1/426025/TSEL_016371.t1
MVSPTSPMCAVRRSAAAAASPPRASLRPRPSARAAVQARHKLALRTAAAPELRDPARRGVAPRRSARASGSVVVRAGAGGQVVTVFGASGRVGRLVVARLLEDADIAAVRAVVRDRAKATEALGEAEADPRFELQVADLRSKADVRAAVEGASAAVWCVSLEENRPSPVDLLKGLLRVGSPKATVDLILEQLLDLDQGTSLALLSSAAVTRTAWAPAKKAALNTVVDIPIVRLNPFGTLDKQREQEQRVRDSGVPYAIVRPVGLNSDWAPGRPVLSQGDVAVGRVNRRDVADVLISAALSEEAKGKTFEVATLAGYAPPADRLETAFSRLFTDEERADAGEDTGFGSYGEDTPGEMAVRAQFNIMQQLLPGAIQDPTRLEMGRTYEEMDAGKVNRSKGAAPTLRERSVAAGIRGRD